MQKTPSRLPKPRGTNKTPKNNTLPNDITLFTKIDGNYSNFSDISTQLQARILRLPNRNLTSFKGLKNFPNVRIIDLQNNPANFSKTSILVAFRSLNIQTINNYPIESADLAKSFDYSNLVTFALRLGMNPDFCDDDTDPETVLGYALEFLNPYTDLYVVNQDTGEVSLTIKGDLYSWFILDSEYQWRQIENATTPTYYVGNYPIKCEIKNAIVECGDKSDKVRNLSVYIPEVDFSYHLFAELSGVVAEGEIISVKAPLTSKIEWKYADDGTVLKNDTLLLPLSADDVGHVIECDVFPGPNLPPTKLFTNEVKPGEFRFKSLRLQGQLVENDEIEFDISTKGTKAIFKGIRILRSARHGEWENIAYIQSSPDGALKYQLTVQDVGCVIRAVCITEGGGPPLMLTSSERVQPAVPHFSDPHIHGSMQVGMPIFAVAHYDGGIQGNCRYEWSIGGSKSHPVIVPTEDDVDQYVTCIMTPIRSDGSIGEPVKVTSDEPITQCDEQPFQERYLVFHKKTKSGKLQMSFVEQKPSENLPIIHENETLIISTACDWAVVTDSGILQIGHSKTFTAQSEYIKGIVVVFGDSFFALAGIVEAASPSVSNVKVLCDKSSSFLSVSYDYTGGIEGRSIIQWNQNDGRGENVIAFGKSFHIGISDRGCTFRAIVTPVSLDGIKGHPIPSEPFLIDDSCITMEEKPRIDLSGPGDVIFDTPIRVLYEKEEKPDPIKTAYVISSMPITNRHKIVWQIENRTIAEGSSYTPTIDDIGSVIQISVIDRIRKETLASTAISIIPDTPSISNVNITFEKKQSDDKKLATTVRVTGDFHGGNEGKSIIIWKAIKPGETEPTECFRGERKWIEIDETWDNAKIGVTYIPINQQSGEQGDPYDAPFVTVPPLRTKIQKKMAIKNVSFVINDKYTDISCEVETTKKCQIYYNWGYIFEGQAQYLKDDVTKVHKICSEDFDYPLFCAIHILDEKNKVIEKQEVSVEPSISERFNPVINLATIVPNEKEQMSTTQTAKRGEVKEIKEEEFMHGQELAVFIKDYQGPPIKSQSVSWERETSPNSNQWTKIIDSDTYTTTMNDYNHRVRAIINVVISKKVLEGPRSTTYITAPKLIGKNKVIRRLAKSIRRTNKAVFDAKLPLGEKVSILIENKNLILKNGPNVLLRTPIQVVQLEITDGTQNTLIMRARHGYNTELTFSERKMSSGTKLSASQTRELFYRVVNRFQKNKAPK